MTEAKDINNIDDLGGMFEVMQKLGISAKGLKTLDQMKDRVKETLKTLKKKCSWTAKEAFSVLTEAKEEDERKRGILYQFYEETEACLNRMDEKVRSFLEQRMGNLSDKMAINKRDLKEKDYIILVAGETSSGKSTLLNLILGEQLLPHTTLSTTSTICELKYGETPKLVAHFLDKDLETGESTKTVWLDQSVKASQQRYLQEISSFVHVKANREKGSEYKKIELFWPHSLLKQGIVIVDSPGIGEADIMDKVVTEYFPKAFAFIYVINSTNAGGIQKDRVVKLIEHAINVAIEQQRELTTRALFVCNKWDQVGPNETDEVKTHIIEKLSTCWPSLDPDSQVICMSSKNATEAQALGLITEEFACLMNGIKTMVLKSIEARLQTQWRFLEYLLPYMAFQTKAFIDNFHKDRAKVLERMMIITEHLKKIEEEQSSVEKELEEYLENKTENAVEALARYLASPDVVKKFTAWKSDEVPIAKGDWEDIEKSIQTTLMARLEGVIAVWEEENHVVADARTFLIQYFQKRFAFIEKQIRMLEISVLADDEFDCGDHFDSLELPVAAKVIIGVTSPIWVPIGLAVVVLGILALIPATAYFAIELKRDEIKRKVYQSDKCGVMAKASQAYLTEAIKQENLRPFVVEQLRECQAYLKQVVARIPELIEADKMLCQQLMDEELSETLIKDVYEPLHHRSIQLRNRLTLFSIKEGFIAMDISCNDLEWNNDQSSLVGTGSFAFVYQGRFKQKDEEQPVALKVWKDELNDSNASVFLAERETLSKLNHSSIVKFYGAALQNEGDQMRGILVMELCKENLMRHIFKNPKNIPSLPSSTPPAERNMIQWAKDIASALDFMHSKGLVHRDLKLENILLSEDGAAKLADVGVAKEAKRITGTMAGTPVYVAPEVVNSSVYDSKADIYSFGIMMWEMWYGKRAFFEIGLDLDTHFGNVVEGERPSHVEGRRKPPDGWRGLTEWCWDGEADKRPTAAKCHEELTKLYQEAVPPI